MQPTLCRFDLEQASKSGQGLTAEQAEALWALVESAEREAAEARGDAEMAEQEAAGERDERERAEEELRDAERELGDAEDRIAELEGQLCEMQEELGRRGAA